MNAAFGVAEIRKKKTQGVAVIEVEIPIEGFKAAVELFDGAKVLVTIAPKEMDAEPFGIR